MRVAARDTRDRNGAGPEPFPRAVLNIASQINTWRGLGKLRKDFAFLPLPAASLIRIISRGEGCVCGKPSLALPCAVEPDGCPNMQNLILHLWLPVY